jgi:hypothetical protein
MAKHDDPGSSSTRGGEPRRGGFGDDQGTRVGKPTPSGRDEDGHPSTRPVDEGLEGAIMDDNAQGGGRTAGAPTEGGAEAARGIHEHGSGKAPRQAGGVSDDRAGTEGHAGSEPLRGRTREHESGYGGSADRPKTSSDQREPLDPEGDANR